MAKRKKKIIARIEKNCESVAPFFIGTNLQKAHQENPQSNIDIALGEQTLDTPFISGATSTIRVFR